MKKKILGLIITIMALCAIGTSTYAATYVNNEDVSNEVFTTISNDYTLFPVRYLGEKLGCDVYWNPDDKCITVSKGDIHRDFYNGSPVVYDWNGNSYSLVTAPMLVDGNTMVPAEFYRDHFGISVLWDSVTSSLFINSEDTYNWLINTPEYKQGNAIDKTWNGIQGYWFHYGDPYTQSTNIQFNSDGTFYLRTWRVKGYGTYTVTGENTVVANYDVYFNGAGSSSFNYYYSTSDTYKLTEYGLMHISSTSDGYTHQYNDYYEHRNSFTTVDGQD